MTTPEVILGAAACVVLITVAVRPPRRRRKRMRFPNGIPRQAILTPADPRPPGCCGACPPLMRGGYDCTCEGNPRCPTQEIR